MLYRTSNLANFTVDKNDRLVFDDQNHVQNDAISGTQLLKSSISELEISCHFLEMLKSRNLTYRGKHRCIGIRDSFVLHNMSHILTQVCKTNETRNSEISKVRISEKRWSDRKLFVEMIIYIDFDLNSRSQWYTVSRQGVEHMARQLTHLIHTQRPDTCDQTLATTRHL